MVTKSNWFYKLFEFNETSVPKKNKQNINDKIKFVKEDNNIIAYTSNNKKYYCGLFIRPTYESLLCFLKMNLKITKEEESSILSINHITINDIFELHYKYPYATFQVASQLNCLEFTNISQTPDLGVTFYENDHTQGPACAIACGPATVYRNYVVNDTEQVNNLDSLEEFLKKKFNELYWSVINGYLVSDETKLTKLFNHFRDGTLTKNEIKKYIRVGIGRESEVSFCKRTDDKQYILCSFKEPILVSQVFCSAIPISYNDLNIPLKLWKPIAMTILEAMYESTILYGINNAIANNGAKHSNKIFLTFIGNGAFGNPKEWIAEAIQKSINNIRTLMQQQNINIQIYFCHYLIKDPLFEQIN
jgi:hypothetical protein